MIAFVTASGSSFPSIFGLPSVDFTGVTTSLAVPVMRSMVPSERWPIAPTSSPRAIAFFRSDASWSTAETKSSETDHCSLSDAAIACLVQESAAARQVFLTEAGSGVRITRGHSI